MRYDKDLRCIFREVGLDFYCMMVEGLRMGSDSGSVDGKILQEGFDVIT